MATIMDGTKVAPHGLFHMEGATGRDLDAIYPIGSTTGSDDGRGPSCFALEEEKGEPWRGSGATRRIIKEGRPTL